MDVIAAIATGSAASAIGIIRVSGAGCAALTQKSGKGGEQIDHREAESHAGEGDVAHHGHVADVNAVDDVVEQIDQLRQNGGDGQPQQQGRHRSAGQLLRDILLRGFEMRQRKSLLIMPK